MATTGQVNTNSTYDSFFWVYWHQEGNQDITNNKTRIYWSCGVTCGHSFYSNAIKMSSVYINGTLVYGGGTYSNFSKGEHRIAYGYMDIPHNADGTKTFNISAFTGWLYSNYNYSAAASTHTLTTIPRKATITASPESFTDQENPSITISNPGGFKMDVWLEPNPVSDHLCIREGITIDTTGRYTWTLTSAEREALRNKCPGNTCTIRLGLYSYVGGTQYADYKDKTFTMVESADTKPAVSVVISPSNSGLDGKFSNLYIQGKSKVSIEVGGSGKFGATINSQYATLEGKTYNSSKFTSDAIQGSGTVRVTGYAKDSRGFTGSAYTDITVIDYAKPLVVPISSENAILCYRSDGNGKRIGNSTSLWIKAKRSYNRVSGKNTCTLEWRWKYAAEEWNDGDEWMPLLSSTDATDEYNAMVSGIFNTKYAYTVQIRATDDLGEYDIKTLDIPTQDVALHLGKGGKNVSIGEYCDYSEERTFRSAWKSIFDDEVIVQGKTLADYIKSVMNGG